MCRMVVPFLAWPVSANGHGFIDKDDVSLGFNAMAPGAAPVSVVFSFLGHSPPLYN